MIIILKNKNFYQPNYSKEIKNGKWACQLYDRCKNRHRKIFNNDKFDLTTEWIKSLPLKCYYTRINLFPSIKNWYVFQPSLDRIDNSKGYTKDNVILVCRGLNSGRNKMEFFEFLNFLKSFKQN